MFALRPSSSPRVRDPRRWRAPLVGPARRVGAALLGAAALLAVAPAAEAAPWVFHAQRDLKGLRLARPVGAEAGATHPLAARVVFSHLSGVVGDGRARLRFEYDLVADAAAPTLVPTVCAPGGPCDRVGMRAGERWVVLPLPPGTPAEAVALVGAGVEAVEHLTGDAAADVLSALAEGSGHGEAVALVGHPLLLARLPPAANTEPRFTLALEWTQAVAPDAGGWWGLSAPPGPSPAQGEGPLAVELQIDGSPEAPVRGVLSPSHAVEVVRGAGAGHAPARVRFRGPAVAEPFELLWTQDATPLGLRVLTHRAADGSAGEPGFLLALAQPEALLGADDPGAGEGAEATLEAGDRGREVVLVVDASGSMRGEKWEQARGAIAEALAALGPADRFNVVLFGNEVASFAPAVLAARPEQVAAAQAWLAEQVPNGRTNLGGALTAALADLAPAAAGATGVARDRLVVLLTDGAPTAGEVDPARILEGLAAGRLARARVVAVGVGQDLDTWLLDQLATRTDGRVLYLDPEEDLDATVAQLVGSLRAPVLDGVTAHIEVGAAPRGALVGGVVVAMAEMKAAQARTYALNPPPPRTVFAGQEVLFTGRFPVEANVEAALVIEGTRRGRPVRLRFVLRSPAEDVVAQRAGAAVAGSPVALDRRFIATLWASHRVAALLKGLRLKGHDEALAQELVELATRYGIVTEYTAFVADAGGDLSEDNRKEAQDNLRTGLLNRSGSWAVNQARNEQSLMRRKVASHTVEAYRDRDGRQQKAKVQRVGGRVFYKQADAWVESAASAPAGAGAGGAPAPKTPVRTVKRYSPEYFDLVKKNADFARAQRLDGDVRMQVGDALVEVK